MVQPQHPVTVRVDQISTTLYLNHDNWKELALGLVFTNVLRHRNISRLISLGWKHYSIVHLTQNKIKMVFSEPQTSSSAREKKLFQQEEKNNNIHSLVTHSYRACWSGEVKENYHGLNVGGSLDFDTLWWASYHLHSFEELQEGESFDYFYHIETVEVFVIMDDRMINNRIVLKLTFYILPVTFHSCS